MYSEKKQLKKRVEFVEVSPSTDLPPLVEGELRCFLVVTIGKLVWSSTTGAQRTGILPPYVRLRWWGEVTDGTYFRSQTVHNERITKTCSQFGIRSGPKQMAAYLNDMGVFTFEVLASMNTVPLGKIQIPNAISLTMNNPIRGYFPIFSASSRKIGKMYISLCFKDLRNAFYDTSESENTLYATFNSSRSCVGKERGRRLQGRRSRSRTSSNGNSSKERSRNRKRRSTSRSSKEGRVRSTSSHKTSASINSSPGRLNTDCDDSRRVGENFVTNEQDNLTSIETGNKAVTNETSMIPTNTFSSQYQFNKPLQDLINQGKRLREEINILSTKPKITNFKQKSEFDKIPTLQANKLQDEEIKIVTKEIPQPMCYKGYNGNMNVVDMVLNAKGLHSDYPSDLSQISSAFSDIDDVLHENEIFQQLFHHQDDVGSKPSMEQTYPQPKHLLSHKKLKALLKFSFAHVTVQSLKLFQQIDKKYTKKKHFSRRQSKASKLKQPLDGIYHVKYKLMSSEISETMKKKILTTNYDFNIGCIQFNQDSNIPIQLDDQDCSREWILETLQFSVFRQKQNETMASCIGIGFLPLLDILASRTFQIDKEIEIVEVDEQNSKLSTEIGTLQISVEIIVEKNEDSPKKDCELEHAIDKKNTSLKLEKNSVTDSEHLEKRCDSKSISLQQYKPVSSIQPSSVSTDTLYLYTSVGSAKNLAEVNILENGIKKVYCSNIYLVCRNGSSNKLSKSQIYSNNSNVDFQFDQITPVKIDSDLFARLQNNFMVIEVWVKTCSNHEDTDDKLMGIIKISLQPLYQSFQNIESIRSVLQAHYPLISVDRYLPIIDPFTGNERGNLSVLLALGTNTQVSTLKKVRNEDTKNKVLPQPGESKYFLGFNFKPKGLTALVSFLLTTNREGHVKAAAIVPKYVPKTQNKEHAGGSIHLQLNVVRISGLKTAAELISISDMEDVNFKYCSEVGVNSYVILKTILNNVEKKERSKCVARSFCPNINHSFIIEFPFSVMIPPAQSLYDGNIELQVWHRPSVENDKFTNDVLLGSAIIPTSNMLTRTSGYKNWITCSLATNDRKYLNVCSMEIRMSYQSQQDFELIKRSSKLPNWSPSLDLNNVLSLNDITCDVFGDQDHITANIAITSARLSKNLLVQMNENEVKPNARIYFRYKFFDHAIVTTTSCTMSTLKRKGFSNNNKAALFKVAHMRSFLCRTTNSLLAYLREEMFEIEAWLTNCRGDKHVKRPLECDILLGKSHFDMYPVLLRGLYNQQHISGVYTLFKGGNELFSENNISITLSFSPGKNLELESSELESLDEISKKIPSFLDCSGNEKVVCSTSNIVETPEKNENDNHFTAMLTVEKAMHLNEIFDQRFYNENISTTSVKSCYVSYNFDASDDTICTDVIRISTSPIWNSTKKIKIHKTILSGGGIITFKVWQCYYDAQDQDIAKTVSESDEMIGFASVDISMLQVGFHTINGWYNILDFQGCCQGQLKVVVTPTDSSNTNIPPLFSEKEFISQESKPTNFRNLYSVPLLGPVHTPSGSMYMPGVTAQNDNKPQHLVQAVNSNENILEKLQKQMKELELIKEKFQQTQVGDVPVTFPSLSTTLNPSGEVQSGRMCPTQVLNMGNNCDSEITTSDGMESINLPLFQSTTCVEDIESEKECSEVEFVCPKSLNEEPLSGDLPVSNLSTADVSGHTTLWMTKSSSQLSASDNSINTICESSEENNETMNDVFQFKVKENEGKQIEVEEHLIQSTILNDVHQEIYPTENINQNVKKCSKEKEVMEQEFYPEKKDEKLTEEEIDNQDSSQPNLIVQGNILMSENAILSNKVEKNYEKKQFFEELKSPKINKNTDLFSDHLDESDNYSLDTDIQLNNNMSFNSLLHEDEQNETENNTSSNSLILADKQNETEIVRENDLNNSSVESQVSSLCNQYEVNDTKTLNLSQTCSVFANTQHQTTILSSEKTKQPVAELLVKDHKQTNTYQPVCFFPPSKDLAETMKAIQSTEIVTDDIEEVKYSNVKVQKKPRYRFSPSLHFDANQTKRLAHIFNTNYTSG